MGDDLLGVSWEVCHIVRSPFKNPVLKDGFHSAVGPRSDDVIATADRSQTQQHPDTLSPDGSVLTVATFRSRVHIYCRLSATWVKQKGRFVSTSGSKASPSNYRSPSRDLGVEQNNRASLKVGSGAWRRAKPIRLSSRWTYFTVRSPPPQTGCFDHEVHASVRFYNISGNIL